MKRENMDSKAVEKYKFYRLYEQDVAAAIHTLKILKRYKKIDVRHALLRDIIVTYVRPFTVSKGHEICKHALSPRLVPSKLKKLHSELLDIRHQIFAHTDLVYKNPKVGKWDLGHCKVFPMSFKGYDYNRLDTRVDDIAELIYSVQKRLWEKIKEFENGL